MRPLESVSQDDLLAAHAGAADEARHQAFLYCLALHQLGGVHTAAAVAMIDRARQTLEAYKSLAEALQEELEQRAL